MRQLAQLDSTPPLGAAPARTGGARSVSTARRGSVSVTARARCRTSRTSTTRRPALPVVRGRAARRRRPRQAGPPARRRRRRRPRTLQDLEKALRDEGYLDKRPDGQLRLSPKAMRQLGNGAARRRHPDVGPPGTARPPPGRCGGRAVRRDPGLAVRRHRAVGRHAHDHQRRAARCRGGCPVRLRGRRRRGHRDRGAHPGRAWRCWSTRRSRWRWTAAGCR